MKKEKYIAVSVGYVFGIVPIDEVKYINLKNIGTKVEYEGNTFELHKAATFEDSTSVDLLLNIYGDYKIKDYEIKEK